MKTIRYLALILLIPVLAILIWQIGLWFDAQQDTKTCGDEFSNISGVKAFQAYANDDFWTMNNGKNINCTVFWSDGYLTHTSFASGSLTKQMVEDSKYWKG